MPQTIKPVINKSSRVRMHYSLRLENGFEVDAAQGDEVLEFQLGDGTLLPGLEQLLLGLKAGDACRFGVPPEQAFGERDPAALQRMPRESFGELSLEEGQVIGFNTPTGDELPGTVRSIDGDFVEVDFNHPLAGHHLDFEVSILEVGEDS